MRFVAIFNQYQVPNARSFEATNFLFWGYEDRHLLPYGIYDQLTDQTTHYTHAGQLIHSIQEDTIRSIAKWYLVMTHRPVLMTLS